jgi:hypothetical protein
MIIIAWFLSVTLQTQQPDLVFEDRDDCIKALAIWQKVKKDPKAECVPVKVMIVEEKEYI